MSDLVGQPILAAAAFQAANVRQVLRPTCRRRKNVPHESQVHPSELRSDSRLKAGCGQDWPPYKRRRTAAYKYRNNIGEKLRAPITPANIHVA